MDPIEKPSPFASLRIADFRNFVIARFFMVLAVQMQMTTIGFQVYYEFTPGLKEEMRAYLLGLVALYEAVPFIATSFFSGHVADVLNRKRIIVISIFVLMLGSLFLMLFSKGYFPSLRDFGYYPLMAVVAVFGITRAFLAAATPALMSQIVPRNLYTNSATWNSTMWHKAAIAGPVLAGVIYGFNNGKNAVVTYEINSVLFFLSLVSFMFVKGRPVPPKQDSESIFRSLTSGVRFVFKQKTILSALSLDLFAVLFGGAVAMIPAFTDQVLHMGPKAAGALRTAPAAGAVLMAAILAFRPPGKNAGKLLLLSVIAFGIFTIGFALSTNYYLAFAFLFLTGAFDNISVVIRHTILQLLTPENMRGRVSAVNGIFIGSSNEIGSFESGLAARIMGLVPSIIFGGAMVIGVVGGVNFLNPELKGLDMNKAVDEKKD